MKLSLKVATTSKTVNVFIRDSSSTTGGGLTGLVFNTAGLSCYYALPRAAPVAVTLATLAAVTSAYSSGGFIAIDGTNMPGWYRFDIPDAALASGAFVNLHFKGATNMAPLPIEIELTGWDNQNATTGGLTNLDAAITSRLAPTVAARTLDVSAGGEAGIDWANIGSPTTAQNLSATNIDVDQIVASVSGAVGSVTGAVGSVTGAVGSVTGNVGGNVVGSVASVTAAVAITSNVKKNQALTRFEFMMTDSTTHAPVTGKAVTVTRSIDGAAFAAGTLSAVTEVGVGIYYVDFAAADLNGNVITLRATAATSDDTFATIVTQP